MRVCLRPHVVQCMLVLNTRTGSTGRNRGHVNLAGALRALPGHDRPGDRPRSPTWPIGDRTLKPARRNPDPLCGSWPTESCCTSSSRRLPELDDRKMPPALEVQDGDFHFWQFGIGCHLDLGCGRGMRVDLLRSAGAKTLMGTEFVVPENEDREGRRGTMRSRTLPRSGQSSSRCARHGWDASP